MSRGEVPFRPPEADGLYVAETYLAQTEMARTLYLVRARQYADAPNDASYKKLRPPLDNLGEAMQPAMLHAIGGSSTAQAKADTLRDLLAVDYSITLGFYNGLLNEPRFEVKHDSEYAAPQEAVAKWIAEYFRDYGDDEERIVTDLVALYKVFTLQDLKDFVVRYAHKRQPAKVLQFVRPQR